MKEDSFQVNVFVSISKYMNSYHCMILQRNIGNFCILYLYPGNASLVVCYCYCGPGLTGLVAMDTWWLMCVLWDGF